MFDLVGVTIPNKSPFVEYPLPSLLLILSFCPLLRVVFIDFSNISVLPIAPTAIINILHSIFFSFPSFI